MLLQFTAHPKFRFAAIIVCCIICADGIQKSSSAQEKEIEARSFRDRVCDFAILSDGARLTGIALSESPVRLVLRLERLKADAPNLFTEEIQPAIADQLGKQNKELIAILRQRIAQLKMDEPDDRRQIGLLDEIIERLNPNDNQAPPWIIVEIEPKRLKRLETLAPNRRELARFALLNQIDDFESQHWKTVTTRLQAIPAAQLKRPTTASQQTSPDVIADRILAAVDVRLNKATRLIRTGDAFVAEDAKPDLATLMTSLLGGSLNKTLQDLLNETGGLPPNPLHDDKQNNSTLPEAAIRLAENSGNSTVVVSSFDFDLARGAASVSRQLFRNSKPGGWKLLSATTGSSTTNDVTQEQVQKIEEDPQVKQISGLLSQLSPDPNALKTALQMGAVVQSALSKTEAAFQATIQDLITARAVNDETLTIVLKAAAF